VQQFVLVLVNNISHLPRASYRSKPKETLTLTWCMDVSLIFTRGKGIGIAYQPNGKIYLPLLFKCLESV
jgi:hypothetical protein